MFPAGRSRLILVSTAVGACFGLAALGLGRAGFTTRWQRLPLPPEPPRRILAVSSYGLWIETLSGTRYFFSPLSPEAGWSQSDTSSAPLGASEPSPPVGVWMPPLSGVTSIYDTQSRTGNLLLHLRYATAKDGSIYLWQYQISPLTAPTFVLYLVVGVVLALLATILVTGLRWPPGYVRRGSPSREIVDELLRSPRHPRGW